MTRQPWPPKLASITVHPGERPNLNERLPTATVFGEPIPHDTTITESAAMTPGTIRLQFNDGTDITCTLGKPPPQPQQWIRCDTVTGPWPDPFGRLTP